MRFYVVGGPGSGKTSLANALGAQMHLPLLHLDDRWSGLFARPRPPSWTWPPEAIAAREALVSEYLARDGWVIEGAEPAFLNAFAAASDLIVWCDVPFRVAATRMVRRHLVADLTRNNAYPGYRRLFRFLRQVRKRYLETPGISRDEWAPWTRGQVAAGVERYQAKVLRLSGGPSSRLVRQVTDRLGRMAGA